MGSLPQRRTGARFLLSELSTTPDRPPGLCVPGVRLGSARLPGHPHRGDEGNVRIVRVTYITCYLTSRNSYQTFYPEGPKNSQSFSRIVSQAHAQRIKKLIESTKGTIVFGGDTDVAERYIAPTLVKDVKGDDSLMGEYVSAILYVHAALSGC